MDVGPALPAMRRYARALTGDDSRADDLVQESLVRALEHAGTFQRGRPLKAWLLAIVHNQFISGQRKRQVERRRDAAIAALDSSGSYDPTQETAVYLRQVADRFAALPAGQRATLHLVAVEGLSYQQAADAQSIPVGTVMSRLARARAALREEVGNGDQGLRIVGGRDAG